MGYENDVNHTLRPSQATLLSTIEQLWVIVHKHSNALHLKILS